MSRCSDDEAVAAEALSKGRVKKALLVVPTLRRMFSMEGPLLRGVSRPRVDGIQWGRDILLDLQTSGLKVAMPFMASMLFFNLL